MKVSKLILFTLIALLVLDIIQIISDVDKLNLQLATYLSALLKYISILIFVLVIYRNKLFKNTPKTIKRLFQFWLIWNIFNIIRGVFLAINYWDWKFLLLSSLPFSLIALVFFVGNNLFFTKVIFQFTLKYIFLFGFLIIPLALTTDEELYSKLMNPVSLFIIFIPYLKGKWKLLTIIVAITSVLLVIDFRANILRIIFSVVLLAIYYLKNIFGPTLIRVAHKILFITPMFLFMFAVLGNFNIFEEFNKNESYTTVDSDQKESNLLRDSRTFLYVEVLLSLNNSGNWLLGESASGSYYSNAFGDADMAGRGIRYRSEVNILNILLYHGVVGVILYLLLLYKVSYYAIYKSNNRLSKMLGLFIAFRWTMAFIEEFTQYDLNFYFFWLVIGLVSTKQFINMSDKQLINFFKIK
jgi:hypothetical protein